MSRLQATSPGDDIVGIELGSMATVAGSGTEHVVVPALLLEVEVARKLWRSRCGDVGP